MKSAKIVTILVLALGLIVCSGQVSGQTPIGTAITYQGRLMDANQPADAHYDFQFKLYNAESDGNQVGGDVNLPDVYVKDGLFGVELDFGSDVFVGDARWLEIGVRSHDPCDVNAFTRLIPRREVTPVPYALQTRGIYVDYGGNAHIDGNIVAAGAQVSDGPVEATKGFMAGDTTFYVDGWIRTTGEDLIFKTGGSSLPASANDETEGIEVMRLVEQTGRLGIGTINPSERLHVDGSVRIVDGSEASGRVLTSDATGVASWQVSIPRGVIVMWSGLLSNIPGDWALCDGGTHTAPNGDQVTTPNLISRFIRSIPDASTDPGSTGGFSNHSHGSGSYSGAGHSHSYSGTTSQGGNVEYCCSVNMKQVPSRNTHTHTYSGTTSGGGGGAISGTSGDGSSLPPYFELAFIMKL